MESKYGIGSNGIHHRVTDCALGRHPGVCEAAEAHPAIEANGPTSNFIRAGISPPSPDYQLPTARETVVRPVFDSQVSAGITPAASSPSRLPSPRLARQLIR